MSTLIISLRRKMIELLLYIFRGFVLLSLQLSGVLMDIFLFKTFTCHFAIGTSPELICGEIFKRVCWQ